MNSWDCQGYSTVLGPSKSLATNTDAHVCVLQNGTANEFETDNTLALSAIGIVAIDRVDVKFKAQL